MPVHPKYVNGGKKVEGWEYCSDFGKWSLLQRKLAEEKQNFYNLATGASITGFQRAQMMEAIVNVNQPLYCDTDSIVCDRPGSLRIGQGIGEWKKEAACNYGAIAGKKLYAFRQLSGGYKIASKGVKLSSQEIIKVAKGESVEAQNLAPTFTIHKQPYLMTRKIIMKKDLQTL